MNEPVIVAAKRTAFGKYGGTLRHLEPEQLMKPLFQYYSDLDSNVMQDIDEVVLGNVIGNGGNIARKALLEAGLNERIPGITLDQQCGSGLAAIQYACRMIQAGAGKIYLAGGVESSSRAPWKIKRPQSVYETQLPQFYDRASFAPEGQDPSMIEAAENVAQQFNISRAMQDQYTLQSYERTQRNAVTSISQEILSLTVKGQSFFRDESVKSQVNERFLSRLKPLISGGTVTAGNSCMKNDGAVLLLVMEKETAIRLGYTQGLQFMDSVTTGVSPETLGIGPIPAVKTILERQSLDIADIHCVELNEAFASKVLACQQQLGITDEQLNRWGGALATGHPYGASGAAIVTRLFYMDESEYSIATMGIGGGMGDAVLFKRWR
ncbi:acetyl-CoA C-acyltransferase [Staphylococcus auricularis]|uniref:Putative acetyl-CoA C-acetyltransferase VraB n=1 Tax=Staphylococcus auricularis TaxID=29379 RepID=A0AAW7MEE5_9STAP|nr:acetyl-CoA C-acyltransferase [Staphylococcus auricularis]MDC6327749.1 acetyl-CoA C-acyltransferase [Staphylococcus auricularis]MDN4533700.1 acetyl-CoA C-acyltransferase [Staphylococcus auricularis]HJE01230.1 acetyl-CoA C-acyltransferase [Staphylococcus auricularis]